MKPHFFKTPTEFRNWLKKYHSKENELWIGYYKKSSPKEGITYNESLEEALCFGWIDGIRKSFNEDSYIIRFTPRKQRSIWSQVNIKKVKELIMQGRMEKPGMDAFNSLTKERVNKYSFEQKSIKLNSEYEKIFKRNKKAREFFSKQPPSYRKQAVWWVISAKQEATRLRRLNTLIEDSKNDLRIKELRRAK